jgi:hypothetical protein
MVYTGQIVGGRQGLRRKHGISKIAATASPQTLRSRLVFAPAEGSLPIICA